MLDAQPMGEFDFIDWVTGSSGGTQAAPTYPGAPIPTASAGFSLDAIKPGGTYFVPALVAAGVIGFLLWQRYNR